MGKNQEVAEEYTKNVNVRKTKATAEFTSLLSRRQKTNFKKTNNLFRESYYTGLSLGERNLIVFL